MSAQLKTYGSSDVSVVDVIFEGYLSRSWGMQDVLKSVLAVENQPYGVLRISSPSLNMNGRLAIAGGKFIIGALITDRSESGYDAVRALLQIRDGNFAYLDTADQRPDDFDEKLYLSIAKLLSHLPDLPETPADLFDEKSLLDKVFGADDALPNSEQIPTAELEIEKGRSISRSMPVGPTTSAAKKSAWAAFQPLLSNSGITSAANRQKLEYPLELNETGSHRQSLTKLRAVRAGSLPWYRQLSRDSFSSKRAMLWIAAIFVLAAIATLFGSTAVFHPNSLTIQKGTTPRTQP